MKSLLESNVITTPWPYAMVNNMFDENTFSLIQETVEKLSPFIKNERGTVTDRDNMNEFIPDLLVNKLNSISNSIMDNHIALLSKFNNYNENEKYYVTYQIGYCKNSWFKIHHDDMSKSLTILIYISPADAIGTILYTDDTEDDFHSVVTWTLNNGIMFSPIQDKTWHNYLHYGEEPRFTLTFHIRNVKIIT
jgi:hypothetical protein